MHTVVVLDAYICVILFASFAGNTVQELFRKFWQFFLCKSYDARIFLELFRDCDCSRRSSLRFQSL